MTDWSPFTEVFDEPVAEKARTEIAPSAEARFTEACWLTALTSLDVTEPPTMVLIRLDSALIMLCTPRVETLPTDRADVPLTTAETTVERVLCALVRFETVALVTDKAWETTEAAFEAAFATERAFEAAVDTTDTALLTVLTRASTEVTATETVLTWLESTDTCWDKALCACERTLCACDSTLKALEVGEALPPVPAEMRLDSAFRIDWTPRVDTFPTDLAETPLTTPDTTVESALCEEVRLETVALVTDKA